MRPGAVLWEYPITKAGEQNPNTGRMQPHFDYDSRAASARQVARQAELESTGAFDAAKRADYHTQPPLNQRGPVRGVTDQYGNVVGAMAHPKDDRHQYERAHLEPLDREGRQYRRRYQDQYGSSRGGRVGRQGRLGNEFNFLFYVWLSAVLVLYSARRR